MEKNNTKYLKSLQQANAQANLNKDIFLRKSLDYAKNSSSILDIGCGECSKINFIAQNIGFVAACDLNSYFLKKAKDSYAKLKLINANAQNLPIKSEVFDIVTAFFSLEHTDRPDRIIDEMLRVVKKGGSIIISLPNFGSPLCASPCNREDSSRRFFRRFINSLYIFLTKKEAPAWEAVAPLTSAEGACKQDADTKSEIYMQNLLYFFKKRDIKILYADSNIKDLKEHAIYKLRWYAGTLRRFKIDELFYRLIVQTVYSLGVLRIAPFKWYGPRIDIIARKDYG